MKKNGKKGKVVALIIFILACLAGAIVYRVIAGNFTISISKKSVDADAVQEDLFDEGGVVFGNFPEDTGAGSSGDSEDLNDDSVDAGGDDGEAGDNGDADNDSVWVERTVDSTDPNWPDYPELKYYTDEELTAMGKSTVFTSGLEWVPVPGVNVPKTVRAVSESISPVVGMSWDEFQAWLADDPGGPVTEEDELLLESEDNIFEYREPNRDILGQITIANWDTWLAAGNFDYMLDPIYEGVAYYLEDNPEDTQRVFTLSEEGLLLAYELYEYKLTNATGVYKVILNTSCDYATVTKYPN